MTLASGIFKKLAYKVESTYGTVPSASSAQALRRVQATLGLSKDTYTSAEIRTDMQVSDFRHGVRKVSGNINGELSPATYKDFIAAALKRDFAAVSAISSVALTIAGSGPTYTVTRGSGSYLTDGVKIGDIIRLSVGSLNASNISKNLMVTALTATVATVIVPNASSMVAEGPISGCTVTVIGKKTYVPATGHTDKSWAIEAWYSDISQSEVFSGCKVSKVNINLPPSGMATIGLDFMGKDITTAASQYFTSPTAATTTGVLAAVNGVIRLNSVTVAIITGLSVEINSEFTSAPVVGSNTISNAFPGTVKVSGQVVAQFQDETLRDVFINETEVDLYAVFTTDNTAAADFVQIALPRIKFGGASKNDGQGSIVQTIPFTALYNSTGGTGISKEATTISIQDSQA